MHCGIIVECQLCCRLFPAAIVYVEDVEEVKQALLACTVDNGYKISTRGGNHSYQGTMVTMDGYVMIDMGLTILTWMRRTKVATSLRAVGT